MEFEQWWNDQNVFWGDVSEHIAERIFLSIKQERESCAKICDLYSKNMHQNMADLCADAIRARSTAI